MDQTHHAASEQRGPAGVVGDDVQDDLCALRMCCGENIEVGEDQDQTGGLRGDPVSGVISDIAKAVVERVQAASVEVGEVQCDADPSEEVSLR